MTQSEFNDRWKIENLPACDEGMLLLKKYADAHPEKVFGERSLLLQTSEDLDDRSDSLWKAFAEHLSHCDDCKEI